MCTNYIEYRMIYFSFNLAKYGPICEKTYPQKLVTQNCLTCYNVILDKCMSVVIQWGKTFIVKVVKIQWIKQIDIFNFYHIFSFLCSFNKLTRFVLHCLWCKTVDLNNFPLQQSLRNENAQQFLVNIWKVINCESYFTALISARFQLT